MSLDYLLSRRRRSVKQHIGQASSGSDVLVQVVSMLEDPLAVFANIIGRFGVYQHHMSLNVALVIRRLATEAALVISDTVLNVVDQKLHNVLSCNITTTLANQRGAAAAANAAAAEFLFCQSGFRGQDFT
jgi:hypothetical protein